MKISINLAISLLVLNGCATYQDTVTQSGASQGTWFGNSNIKSVDNNDAGGASAYVEGMKFKQNYQDMVGKSSVKAGYPVVAKNINDYVRGITQDLIANLQYVNKSTPVVVSSFVYLDSDYQTSTLLGNQISESFIHEIHKYGIPVIDFKATDFIRITPQGDFVLSRDYTELKPDLPMKYVLTGTLARHMDGVIVNARVIGIASKAVVASAQGFLPNDVANALLKEHQGTGISLVKQ